MDSLTHLELQTGLARSEQALVEEQRVDSHSWLAGYYAGRVSAFKQVLGLARYEEASE